MCFDCIEVSTVSRRRLVVLAGSFVAAPAIASDARPTKS